jgi:predicted metal-dependent phosphoesterase TrpH
LALVSSIDLHIHSYYSDGRHSPAEIVDRAARIGLETIALADHDNARGVREAAPLARARGIRLIPAIELTCHWEACPTASGESDIDVLGYFFDLDNARFRRFEQAALDDIHVRIADCCARLTAAGAPITLEDVLAENPRYAGLLQLIHALQHVGHAADWGEAFTVSRAHWARVAFLAHPSMVQCGGAPLGADRIAALVEMGLDGLEVYHYRLDAAARAHFLDLARRFDLLVSGGSDSHGGWDQMARMGMEPVTDEMVREIEGRHLERA